MPGAPPLRRLLRELVDIPAVLTAPLRGGARPGKLGTGQPVLVLPGFLANDAATAVLRNSFTNAGFRAFGWEMGLNVRIRADLLDRLEARVRQVSQAAGGEKVTLVGWSLGGLYARALGHHAPELLRLIVSLGSPFAGDLRSNHAWRLYEALNDHDVRSLPIQAEFATKPPVRTIAVWSPLDGVVAPETSRGDPDQSDERIELRATHLGFAASKRGAEAVVRLVAERI